MNDSHTTRLLPVNAWGKHHDWPTPNALRHYIHRSKSNGFDRVIRRVGRRVLIDEAAFFDWVQSCNGGNDHA